MLRQASKSVQSTASRVATRVLASAVFSPSVPVSSVRVASAFSSVAASSLAPAVSRAIAPVQVVGIVPSASFAKKNDKGKDKDAGKKGGKKGSSSSDGEEGDGNAETFGVNVAEHKENMENVITYFEAELTHIKIGRPAPEQIEDVSVDIGGGKRSPLGSIAQIYVKPPQSLVVVLYEPSAPLETATCQAIAAAGLDLNPISEIINGAAAIRVPFPKPTTELRESLVKSAKTKGEDFKGQVRHVRKAWLDAIKKKSPPEDAARRMETDVQKATDAANEQIGKLVIAKEKEIMST